MKKQADDDHGHDQDHNDAESRVKEKTVKYLKAPWVTLGFSLTEIWWVWLISLVTLKQC